jgi:hypothetical protein
MIVDFQPFKTLQTLRHRVTLHFTLCLYITRFHILHIVKYQTSLNQSVPDIFDKNESSNLI